MKNFEKLRGIVNLMIIAMFVSILFSCNDAKKEKNEKDDDDDKKETVVKITPEFSKKVQQYEWLNSYSEGYAAVGREIPLSSGGVKQVWSFIDVEGNEIPQCQYEYVKDFSEGLAAVMKDGQYGFINTKGEVVIPFNYGDANCFGDGLVSVYKDGKYCYIDKEGVEVISIPVKEDEYIGPILTQFSDGVAFVIKPHDWDSFEYYAIDKTGKKLFEGNIGGWCSEEGGRFNDEYLPKFSNGEVYIPAEEYETYDVYNKKGEKLRTEKGKSNNNKKYEIVGEWTDTVSITFITRYGMKEISTDKMVIPVIYDEIKELNKGVALACIYEYSTDPYAYGDWSEMGYAERMHWGYVDLYGNDTFSKEVKEKSARSLEVAKSNVNSYVNSYY